MSKPAYEEVDQPYEYRYLPFNYRFVLSDESKKHIQAIRSVGYEPGQIIKLAIKIGLQQIMAMDTDEFAKEVAEDMKEALTTNQEEKSA